MKRLNTRRTYISKSNLTQPYFEIATTQTSANPDVQPEHPLNLTVPHKTTSTFTPCLMTAQYLNQEDRQHHSPNGVHQAHVVVDQGLPAASDVEVELLGLVFVVVVG